MKPNLRETIMLRRNKYVITIFQKWSFSQGIIQNIIHLWFYDESLVLNDVGSIRYAYPYYIILIQGQYALNLDNIQNFLSHSGLKTFLFVSKILKVFCQHSSTSNNITKNQMHANIYRNIYSTLVTYIVRYLIARFIFL